MGKNEKILIVDDEPDFVEACRMTLEARHYQVMTTSSKSLAQEMMKADPDLIVLGTLAPAGQAFSIYQWVVQHPRYRDIPEPSSLVPRIQSLLEEATRLIRVLVADDHTMVRTGICAVLALQKGLEVVGEAVDGRDAVEKALRLLPHVALMDIVMPGVNGLEATKRISSECPETKVLILSQYDEEENMLVARQAGAYGFIPKKAASSDLVAGIRNVYGGRYFPASFAEIAAN
ncbi:response regulator [Dehalococcoidia bacterium]|nr:response regulator [Dehalococcoidia bacterium]